MTQYRTFNTIENVIMDRTIQVRVPVELLPSDTSKYPAFLAEAFAADGVEIDREIYAHETADTYEVPAPTTTSKPIKNTDHDSVTDDKTMTYTRNYLVLHQETYSIDPNTLKDLLKDKDGFDETNPDVANAIEDYVESHIGADDVVDQLICDNFEPIDNDCESVEDDELTSTLEVADSSRSIDVLPG